MPSSSPAPDKDCAAAEASLFSLKFNELNARYQALKLRHRLVLDERLDLEEMLATGTAVYAQLRERLEEEEAERARIGSELEACKGQLQALKDKSLEWCGSYMESAVKVRNMEEQYRLDRAEWRSDLKDMQDQRDRYQAIANSQRCDRMAEDRRWHEIEAKIILESLTEPSGEKRKLSAKEVCEEARKRWKGKAKEN